MIKIDGWDGFIAKDVLSIDDVRVLINEAQKVRGGINQRINLRADQVSTKCRKVLSKISDWIEDNALDSVKELFSEAFPKFDIDSVNWKPTLLLSVNTSAPIGAAPVRSWHLDRGDKLYAGMLYVNDGETSDLPRLYYGSDPSKPPLGYVEHKGSTMVIWPNTPFTWHGVTARPPSGRNRVMVNFYAESDVWVHSYKKIGGVDHTNPVDSKFARRLP